jgi:hypothetical protein
MNIRMTLRDAHGNVVEEGVYTPEEARKAAAQFVFLHGSDPEENGRGAQAGSIRFEPTDEPADDDGPGRCRYCRTGEGSSCDCV